MSERSTPIFCHCCSQILQILVDADPDRERNNQKMEQGTVHVAIIVSKEL